ncbi:hypothetical protein [Amycolatopsis tolypomycina]|uniref:hypothetical protein n=1 Tax=Amycolatopsis tolypomycina TaxID=208445 RepID=UPI0033AF7D97
MAGALDAESLTRRHWQVLNTIALGARTAERVDAAMAPFVAGEGSMAPKVADLRARDYRTTLRTLERCAANLEAAWRNISADGVVYSSS